jgi:hypothetical protein
MPVWSGERGGHCSPEDILGSFQKRAPEDLHISAGRVWTASGLDTDVVAAAVVHIAVD